MTTKSKPPQLPVLPKLGAALPAIGALPSLTKPKTIAEMTAANVNPLDRNNEHYLNDAEHDVALDVAVISDEFAAIRAARAQQAAAIDLANETEFWFAMHFQTREQKEVFVAALGLKQDKYIDGQEAAAILGIKLPPRPAPYKVGKIDKKLAALT